MSKFIFASNRLPFELKLSDGEWTSKLSVSGLVSGVLSAFKEKEGVWVGWAGQHNEICQKNKHILEEWAKQNIFAVEIPTDLLSDAHENFNNRALWSLFHGFLTFVDFERSEWEAYKEYNKLFADVIIEKYSKGDIIIINDFQLMLVPKLIKEQHPTAIVKYFHHIVFPCSDIFNTLPVAKNMLEGVIAADTIQFHTQKQCDNFLNACEIFNLDVQNKRIEANPIGIDPQQFKDYLSTPFAKERAKWMKSCFWNKKIVCSVERIDPIKGILERLQAFEYMLDTYPELQGQVVLVQIAVGSRENTQLYKDLQQEIDKMVGKINGKFSGLDWQAVKYINTGFPQSDLAILYSISDVACITSLSDGFNLVSLEYCVSESELKDRTLILSKFAGASEHLTDAFIVNPYDYVDVGDKMAYALRNGGNGMMEKLQKTINENTIHDWIRRLIDDSTA